MKIFVADNSELIRRGFSCLLADVKEFDIESNISNAEELNLALKKESADVLIIDHLSLGINFKYIQELRRNFPNMFILGLTTFPQKSSILKALASGVTSYLLKECDREEIIEAIQSTRKGKKFICGKILSVLTSDEEIKMNGSILKLSTCEGSVITDRELEIVQLIAQGYSNKQIADKLFLSQHTVTTHRKNIMSKLGVNNTAGVVMFAVKNNLLEPNNLLFS